MNPELQSQIEALEAKVDSLEATVGEKQQRSKIWIWIAVAAVVLPLIGLAFAIPRFLNIYTNLPF